MLPTAIGLGLLAWAGIFGLLALVTGIGWMGYVAWTLLYAGIAGALVVGWINVRRGGGGF